MRTFIDPHVHLWDQRANDWYRIAATPLTVPRHPHPPYPEVFGLADYRAALSAFRIVKIVHVTATPNLPHVPAEVRWVTAVAQAARLPLGVVGAVDIDKPANEVLADLDALAAIPTFRGIRVLRGLDYESLLGQAVLARLNERGLVYDVVAHPNGTIATAAKAARKHPALSFVLEHAGWPTATDERGFTAWREEMAEFAASPNTVCKLSGLTMAFGGTDKTLSLKYFDECIALFGAARCMFASNFPVDLAYGGAAELMDIFETIASRLSGADADCLFGKTAERVYRI